MKLQFRFPVVILILISSQIFAQPLTGTMSIGGVNSDFPTITAAIDSLNLHGTTTGGVTFSIRGGTYNEPPVAISTTSDSSRPVIIKVDSGATVNWNVVSQLNDTIGVTIQSPYVTIDGSWRGDQNGKHLTLQGDSLFTTVWFRDNSSHSTVKNCNFFVNRIFDSDYIGTIHIEPLDTTNHLRSRSVVNCKIEGGNHGIFTTSNFNAVVDSLIILNNRIINFSGIGICLISSTNNLISHNRIYQTVPAPWRTSGIEGGNQCLFDGNEIGPLICAQGTMMHGIVCASNNTYMNNMIRLSPDALGGSSVHGIIDNTGSNNKFLFNSVFISGTFAIGQNGGSGNSSCFMTEGRNDTLFGNIFVSSRIGPATYHTCFYFSSNTYHCFSNYNLFYSQRDITLNNTFMTRVNQSGDYLTLADWRLAGWAPRDSLSFWENAPFVSDTNLHIQTNVQTDIESGAPHHWQVLTDIDGDVRTNPRCDIGADEGDFNTTIVRSESANPLTGFSLDPIYPNPFNSSTEIHYSVFTKSKVEVKVYDVTGKEITKLVDSILLPGQYSVHFDGSALAAGTYFIRMKSNHSTLTRKIELIK